MEKGPRSDVFQRIGLVGRIFTGNRETIDFAMKYGAFL